MRQLKTTLTTGLMIGIAFLTVIHIGAQPPTIPQALNLALKFSGNLDSYVDCGNDPTFNINDSFTLEALIKPTRVTDNWMTIISKSEEFVVGGEKKN